MTSHKFTGNKEHLKILQQGMEVWNRWRKENPDVRPDLNKANLSKASLSGADLSEAVLRGADLSWADLHGANLSGANLDAARIRRADLREADLRGAHLGRANLRQACLLGAHLSEADLSGADLSGAHLNGAYLNRADLSGADLSEANLRWAYLNRADLNSANLSEADLGGAHFIRADLGGANLRGANLRGANLRGANLRGANFRRTHLSRADLSEADLSEADFSEADFSEADLSEVDLDEAVLSMVLSEADYLSDVVRDGINDMLSEADLDVLVETDTSVNFTAFYPGQVLPERWYKLLVYVHLPSAFQMVLADKRSQLGAQAGDFLANQDCSALPIKQGTEIVVVPELPGHRFNPPRASLLWLEAWHRAEFQMQADPDLPGFELDQAVIGRVAFYVGPILVSEVRVSDCISNDASDIPPASPDSQETAKPYQSIFVSYSRKDAAIVDGLEKAYKALGMEYLRDVRDLRSGEKWDRALLGMIEKADIFQLCWSNNAKGSRNVRQEWQHALGLGRPNFIRPVYWEKPLPKPPRKLKDIHFAYYQPGGAE